MGSSRFIRGISTLNRSELAAMPEAIPANSKAAIELRAAVGRLDWAGPLMLIFGRIVLCLLAQALMSGLLWLQGHPTPSQAAAWWTAWGTMADLGCLAAMFYWTRREGLRLVDLFSFSRRRLGPDLLLGVGIFLVVFPVCITPGTMQSSWLIFGTLEAPMYAGELTGRVLPFWAAIYSASLWWIRGASLDCCTLEPRPSPRSSTYPLHRHTSPLYKGSGSHLSSRPVPRWGERRPAAWLSAKLNPRWSQQT